MSQQLVGADIDAIDDHVIGRRAIDESYEALRRTVTHPQQGIFGPDSMLWRMLEPLPVLPLMLVQAGLLELATPKIYFGTEHSITRSGDYNSRFARSYEAFADWFFGDLDTALATARRVHGYHTRIGGHAPQALGQVKTGTYYRATEEQLMIFTVGTQIVPIKQLYELLVRPLTEAEAEQYYEEVKRFSMLFGIDVDAMPPSWPRFEEYWQQRVTSGELELADEGLNRMGPFVDPTQLPFAARIAVTTIMTLQFNLLPGELQRQYAAKLPLAKPRPRTAKAIALATRALLRLLPRGAVSAPRVLDARRRAGQATPHLRGESRARRALAYPFGDALPSMCTPASPEADPKHSKALTQKPVP